MQYSDFGLDVHKKSKDKDQMSGHLFDPFSEEQTGERGFSLCFSNWALTEKSLQGLLTTEPQANTENEQCWHCRQRKEQVYFSPGTIVCLCVECTQLALEYLNKPVCIVEGTQLKLF